MEDLFKVFVSYRNEVSSGIPFEYVITEFSSILNSSYKVFNIDNKAYALLSYLYGNTWKLYMVYVKPKYRKTKISKQLFDEIEKWSKDNKITIVTDALNSESEKILQKYGFKPLTYIKEF